MGERSQRPRPHVAAQVEAQEWVVAVGQHQHGPVGRDTAFQVVEERFSNTYPKKGGEGVFTVQYIVAELTRRTIERGLCLI